MKFLDDLALFALLVNCVDEAAESIMRVYNTDYDIEIKQDKSPVTIADKLSHQILTTKLPEVHNIPVLSEEGNISWEVRKKWHSFWLIDPLDGTREFISKNGQFTINVALVEKHTPIFGILCCPTTKDFYYGAKGRGAYKRVNSHWQRIKVKKTPLSNYTVVSSSLHSDKKTEQLLDKIAVGNRIARGSALKFTYIAEGKAQLYPRFGPTSLWDTAAGQCIVEEAGGKLVGQNLQPLKYNDREDLLNPSFVACAQLEDSWTSWWQKI